MDDEKLKRIPEINYQKSKTENKNMNHLIKQKEEKKNIHYQKLHFNPTSFFKEKYSTIIPKLVKNKKLFDDIDKSGKKENHFNKTIKRLKLKPLNMNRSNIGTNFLPKIDDILIPSYKTSKELVDYNKANNHNTLLNYYHKNNRNMRIINFIKKNTSDQNCENNQTNKIFPSNESFNNNTNICNNQNNEENPEKALKRSIKTQKSFMETDQMLNEKKRFRKSRIDNYESEILGKKDFLRNLNSFHDNFFNKEEKSNNIKLNPIFKPDNKIKSDQLIFSNSQKEKMELDYLNKNRFLFDFNYKKINRNNRKLNKGNSISYKEMKNLSIQGYRRMKADKKRQFNLRLKKTNSEVLNLEKKLDELLEINKQLFLNAEEEHI